MQIEASDPTTQRKLTVEVNIPSDLQGLIAQYGESLVYYAASEKIRTKALNIIRYYLKLNMPDDDIIETMKRWTPLKVARRTRAAKLELSDEDILDAMSELDEEKSS
jgi:hypothetical protein